MTTIYYLSTIIFLVIELGWLISPIEKANKARKFLELSKQIKDKKWDEFSEEFKSEFKSNLWQVWILIWLFIGLFTFQWAGFLAMLIFNILIVSPLSKLTINTFFYIILHWVNSIVGFVFAIFVIVNHYHLKIDLTQWFIGFIK